MVINILAIGDIANNVSTLKKFSKSKIHLITFPGSKFGKLTESKGQDSFDSDNISEQVKKINKIKKNYDLCLVLSWNGARLAYLCGLNYIIHFVGSALRVPPFINNPKLDYLSNPLPTLNYFERNFYKKVLDNAITCVVGWQDLLKILKKYYKKEIKFINILIDTTLFNEKIKPIEREKSKFTFLSPQRIGLAKGIDIIWKALDLCKSDFEVLQVEWFLGQRTDEEKEINKKLVESRPSQVKLIPVIKREELPRFYASVDAVIGEMKRGEGSAIEKEATYCKKPTLCYYDPKTKFSFDGKLVSSVFLPHSTDPKELADLIDRLVESTEFREKLAKDEYEFVKKVFDPHKDASQWDELFANLQARHVSIIRESSNLKLRIRLLFFLLANRLYLKKVKRKVTRGI